MRFVTIAQLILGGLATISLVGAGVGQVIPTLLFILISVIYEYTRCFIDKGFFRVIR